MGPAEQSTVGWQRRHSEPEGLARRKELRLVPAVTSGRTNRIERTGTARSLRSLRCSGRSSGGVRRQSVGPMIGVTIASEQPFATVFRELLPELAVLHWLLDLQSGPFRITDRPDAEALHLLLDALAVDLPPISSTSASLWRPGTLACLSPLLLHDEQGYHFGLSSVRDEAVRAALQILQTPRDHRLLSALPKHVHFFAFFGHRSWEVFAPNPALASMLARVPNARPLLPADSAFFGKNPV